MCRKLFSSSLLLPSHRVWRTNGRWAASIDCSWACSYHHHNESRVQRLNHTHYYRRIFSSLFSRMKVSNFQRRVLLSSLSTCCGTLQTKTDKIYVWNLIFWALLGRGDIRNKQITFTLETCFHNNKHLVSDASQSDGGTKRYFAVMDQVTEEWNIRKQLERFQQINHRSDHNRVFSTSGWCSSSHYLHLTFDFLFVPSPRAHTISLEILTLVWTIFFLSSDKWHWRLPRYALPAILPLDTIRRHHPRGGGEKEEKNFQGQNQGWLTERLSGG